MDHTTGERRALRDRTAVRMGRTREAPHTRFARYLFTVLSNRTDGTHRLVRNGRHKDGVNAWRRHVEYAPVTSATAQGFMKKSLEIL